MSDETIYISDEKKKNSRLRIVYTCLGFVFAPRFLISKLLNESTETYLYSSFAVLLENKAFTFLKQNVCRGPNIGLAGCGIRVKMKAGCEMTGLLNYGEMWDEDISVGTGLDYLDSWNLK